MEYSRRLRFDVRLALALAFSILFFATPGVAGVVKVDINRDTKNSAAVTAAGYVQWSPDTTEGASTGTNAITESFISSTGETVTVSFAQTALSQSRGGTGLLTNWYQAGAQGNAKLVSDGLCVAPATLGTGGEIVMTITGLTSGTHTLLTYHNAWDALTAGSLGPINVYLNGALAIAGLQPTIRAAIDSAAPVSYLTFNVTGTSAVTTVLFSAEVNTGASVTIKDPMINGFEIDTPNSTRTANNPLPADQDEHVNGDAGSVTLTWGTATAGNAVSHDVYFGTSAAAVAAATHASPEYKATQSGTSYAVTGLNSSTPYYWRIDEVDSVGNVTTGNVWYFRCRHLAFPGAEGWGRFAKGGRGGVVLEVTNLNDNGPGSLRDAIEGNYGSRTIVFSVSGLITLRSTLTIADPYMTIAGQTAPGKGICTNAYTFGLSGGADDIIRFMRSRPGNISGTTLNGSGMAGAQNSIMDHCSISWGIDEEMSTRTAGNVTLQRTFISEPLNVAGHQNYPPGTAHGYAGSMGGNVGSLHHNLISHSEGRNWSMAGGLDASGSFAGLLDITNNVIYNWGSRTTDGGAHEVNFVNNYYKPGASSTFFYGLNAQYDNFPGSQQYYISGNIMPGHFTETNQSAGYEATTENGGSVPTSYSPWVSTPFFTSYVTTQTAEDAFKIVLSDVGDNEPLFDDHDVRVVKETLNGTYTYVGSVSGLPGLPDSQADVGGWENYFAETRPANWDSDHDGMPDWWEQIIGTNQNSAAGDYSDSNADPDGDGYTNLEDYLNWMAAPHAATAPGVGLTIDLNLFNAGFTGQTYTVTSGSGGTAALQADKHTVLFTPTNGFTGLANFSFMTKDSSTTAPQRTVGVAVSALASALFERHWRGGASSVWDAASGNWINGSTIGAYQGGDTVYFDDAGAANPSVQVSGTIAPGNIIVAGTTNYTFGGAGTIGGAALLVQSGSGTLTMNGTYNYTGGTTVQSGALTLNGSMGGSNISVTGGTLGGAGKVSGNVTIGLGGTMLLQTGVFSVSGSVTNNGTIRITGTAGLGAGAILNNGVIDSIGASGGRPANVTNGANGRIIDLSNVVLTKLTKAPAAFQGTFHAYPGHTYQLQESATLGSPVWVNVTGASKTGDDTATVFADPAATGSSGFYRVRITTP